jgi:hypothetical protein
MENQLIPDEKIKTIVNFDCLLFKYKQELFPAFIKN